MAIFADKIFGELSTSLWQCTCLSPCNCLLSIEDDIMLMAFVLSLTYALTSAFVLSPCGLTREPSVRFSRPCAIKSCVISNFQIVKSESLNFVIPLTKVSFAILIHVGLPATSCYHAHSQNLLLITLLVYWTHNLLGSGVIEKSK